MPQGRPVRLETERLVLRSLTPADASQRWVEWSADESVMDPFNRPVLHLTVAEVGRAVARYDDDTTFAVGIFDKASGLHIGIFFIGVNHRDRLGNFAVMIGDHDFWGRNVVNEARAALLDHFFAERGVDKISGTPLARNFPAVFNYKAQGWRLEGVLRKHRCRPSTGERRDLCQFGMLREDWEALKKAQRKPA